VTGTMWVIERHYSDDEGTWDIAIGVCQTKEEAIFRVELAEQQLLALRAYGTTIPLPQVPARGKMTDEQFLAAYEEFKQKSDAMRARWVEICVIDPEAWKSSVDCYNYREIRLFPETV
jgi:hypothetical protein